MDNEIYNNAINQSVQEAKRRRNRLITIVIIGLILLGGAVGYNLWYRNTYSASINLLYAPASSTATLNGSVIQAGTKKIKPGTYTVVIKKAGFTTYSTKVTISKDTTGTIQEALVSNNAGTTDWYTTHPSDQSINEKIGGSKGIQAEQTLVSSFDVSKVLPLTGFTYTINYGASPDKPNQYALFITYYGDTGKQDALSALQSLGYNPSKYEIEYTDGDTNS